MARRADQRRQVLALGSAEGAPHRAQGDRLAVAPPERADQPQPQAQAAAVAAPLGAPVAGAVALPLPLPVSQAPPVACLVAHVGRSRGVSAPVALRQVRAEPPVQVAPLARLLPLAREHGRAVPPVLLTAQAKRVAAPVAAPGPACSAQLVLAVRRVVHARYCRYAVPLALALEVTVAVTRWPRPAQPVVLRPVDRRPQRPCCQTFLLPGQALSVHVQRVAAQPQVARPAVAWVAPRARVLVACHVARGRGCRDWLT